MNKNLLILGAGQYGQVAKEIAENMGCFEKIDFLDDCNSIAVGNLDSYENYISLYNYAIVAIGNSKVRLEWLSKLQECGYEIATLIHPKSYVSLSAQIMKGCIVEPMSVINTGALVNTGCIISAGAIINHNAVCSLGVHVDCNATVAANAVVPDGEKVCSGIVFNKD